MLLLSPPPMVESSACSPILFRLPPEMVEYALLAASVLRSPPPIVEANPAALLPLPPAIVAKSPKMKLVKEAPSDSPSAPPPARVAPTTPGATPFPLDPPTRLGLVGLGSRRRARAQLTLNSRG